jgi:hypothetical protein
MREGYLIVETHPGHPDLVCIRGVDRLGDLAPAPGGQAPADEGPAQVRYAALFSDLETALMHLHGALRRRLIDIDSRLYRCDPVSAVAAAAAIGLRHRDLYLDPGLAADPALTAATDRLRQRRRVVHRIWNGVGIAALLLLILKLVLGV